MTVRRIVANIPSGSVRKVQDFYAALFDLELVMDHGWIVTLASSETAAAQISIASGGGSGTAVPDLSIEVDDVDAIHRRAIAMGCDITYPLTDEPWGVRRLFLADPEGKIVNVLGHLR
jgi:predicted enzyme related to lactoylglutathione lyase